MSKSIPEPNNLPENPKLSVCMIVRDEEKTLPRCLKSVEPVANELIVIDTGSKDNTVLVANDLGAKVFHFEWCDDFAAARNESIKHATSDWVLQIDADEELVGDSIPHLRQCIRKPNVICYSIKCDNGPTYTGPRFGWFDRLFRRHPRIFYHGRGKLNGTRVFELSSVDIGTTSTAFCMISRIQLVCHLLLASKKM